MDRFTKELEVGEIHQRDKWQFELKSEFIPLPDLNKNVFIQEFYLFIPNSLQVNSETYTKGDFYQDQTNLIRYKTPEFSLDELCDEKNKKSPLTRLSGLRNKTPTSHTMAVAEDELKLLGNVLRSSLRERIRKIIEMLDHPSIEKEQCVLKETTKLCNELTIFRKKYLDIQVELLKRWISFPEESHLLYVDEFLSDTINYYLIGVLERLRRSHLKNREDVCERVGAILALETRHRAEILKEPKITKEDSVSNEYILYRSSLLNKFVLDALLLVTNRVSVFERYQNLIGSFAAGIAMLFFFVLFVHQGTVLLVNSSPFILLTVILYILKDRLKESLKTLSYKKFAQWFSDFVTEIFTPDGSSKLGILREYFSFVKEQKVSPDISHMRHREFHVVLEKFKRPEQVLYYKKKIVLYKSRIPTDARRNALNIIFRFNISDFLKKADNPTHEYVTVNPENLEFFRARLPKVYHLNIILKNTYTKGPTENVVEFKKFRLILDKNGIKRVEHFSN